MKNDAAEIGAAGIDRRRKQEALAIHQIAFARLVNAAVIAGEAPAAARSASFLLTFYMSAMLNIYRNAKGEQRQV